MCLFVIKHHFMLKVKLCNAAFDKVSVDPSIWVVHYLECHFLQLWILVYSVHTLFPSLFLKLDWTSIFINCRGLILTWWLVDTPSVHVATKSEAKRLFAQFSLLSSAFPVNSVQQGVLWSMGGARRLICFPYSISGSQA